MLFVAAFLFPIIAGILAGVRKTSAGMLHARLVISTGITDVLCICAMVFGKKITIVSFSENVCLAFGADGLSRIFAVCGAVLYTLVLFYAFEYMKMEEDEERFFAFYMISFGALLSVAFSSNLVTMYLCFEALTLTTLPLVLHELSKEAVAAGLKYLFYSVAGALMGLLAVFFVCYYTSSDMEFVRGGFLDMAKAAGHEKVLLIACMAGIIGFGTKAGLYPMHGWLPTAHPIAPAPASALLSAIVAKAGVIAIIRLIYYSFGADFVRGTWVQTAWMTLAMLTVFMGSMMAFREKVFKKRLAYSSISQISYILLGLSFLTDGGLRGGLIHMMGHVAAKGCLFLVAGAFIYKDGIREVGRLKGIGRKMPVTLSALTIAALSLVGIPPFAGFLSKWLISETAVGSAIPFYSIGAPAVLLISALLTAGYLLTITVDGFFPGRQEGEHAHGEHDNGGGEAESALSEVPALMTVPMMILASLTLAAGLFGAQFTAFLGF